MVDVSSVYCANSRTSITFRVVASSSARSEKSNNGGANSNQDCYKKLF